MKAFAARTAWMAVVAVVALVLTAGSHASQVRQPAIGSGSSAMTGGVTPTVVATLMAREARLVLLVLWRGSPRWLRQGGGNSSSGGGRGSRTWSRATYGGVTLDIEVDSAAREVHLLGQRLSLDEVNIVLIDHADTTPAIVRTLRVDGEIPRPPDALYVVLKREPELVEFLQCDLMRTDPVYQKLRPDYLKALMAVHPCGG